VLSCIYGQGDLPCTVGNETIPDYVCENGYWPNADSEIDGDWIVSRSTHYGSTAGGACGYDNVPNCYYPGASCDIPMEIQTTPYAGQYAAPQGDYYTQLGDYVSCGECFQIKCVDPTCTYNEPIYINLADSCPCKPNPKWCCGQYSDCQELRPDSLTKQPHCYKEPNGTWAVNKSLHLDLNDVAYAMLTTGHKGQVPNSGSVNTLMRRVSCPVNGSVYIMIDGSSMYTDNCYTIYPDPPKPCFRYLAMNVYNVAGYGGVANVTLKCGIVENNKLVYKEIPIIHNPDYPLDNDQERYGDYVGPNSVALYFPIQFIIHDRGGRNISSPVIANFTSGVPAFYNMQTQFPPVTKWKH